MKDEKRIWLEKARKNYKFTQEDVADKVGVARTTYAMYEQNQRTPSVAIAAKIGSLLKVDWQLFFEEQLRDSRSDKTA